MSMLPSSVKRQRMHLDNNNSSGMMTSHGNTKRSSSMIFRIEHLLPSPPVQPAPPPLATTIPTLLLQQQHQHQQQQQSSRILTPVVGGSQERSGVYVSQFTPKNTISESISTIAIMSSDSQMSATTSEQQQQQQQQQNACTFCTISQQVLCMTPSILRRIKLSEDINSYNALFELDAAQNVRVRIVRDIAEKDEIVAWFGEEISMLMSIPFLTPLNIQGNKRYTCHLCHLTFETPNPLKIHLALGCDSIHHSMCILWIRLHYAIKAAGYAQHLLPVSSAASLSHMPFPTAALLTSSTCTSTPSAAVTTFSSQSQRYSAFKPISSPAASSIAVSAAANSSILARPQQPTITTYATLSLPTLATTTTTSMTTNNSSLSFMPSLPPLGLLQPPVTNPLNAAAQIEAIVSNMGASKQGHLCIYCGKIYSRKYGLKIHIRTHTGFKPLKCKFCLRPFGDPSNLNKHVRLHLQTTAGDGASSSGKVDSYKCHLCYKTLARRRDLQRHMEAQHAAAGGVNRLS